MQALTSITLLSLSFVTFVTCTRDDLGTFTSPGAVTRPRFRYWLPDASVDAAVLAEDIRSAGQIGAGGVEFLPFYNYGGLNDPPPPGSDWSTYNFGTPAFQQLLIAALEAHRDGGLRMDVAIGPNQGQGVPAEPSNEGLQWDLVPFNTSIAAGNSFNGVLPGWGSGDLVAAVSVRVISENVIQIGGLPNPFRAVAQNYTQLLAKNGTLQDHTSQVSQSTGHLEASFASEGPHVLFAFYESLTEEHNVVAARAEPQTIFDDGSYIVDHFDARGAQVVIDFWERYLLSDNVRQLLRDVGQCAWEDSMELLSNISWSRSLPSRFQALHGYDIRPYLPLIIFGNNNINLQDRNPGTFHVVLDSPDQGVGFVNDYRLTLANGYQEYLSALVNWTNTALNMSFSSQVSYNLPMDMEASIPFVDIPETESLQFSDNVDGYRQFSAPAYLAGKDVVSIELGAIFGPTFAYTLPNLLFSANRAFAGGINRLVLHGQSFSGNYYGTTWPGYIAFSYLVTEPYSQKQPSWEYGLKAAMDYLSRVGWVQRQGVAKLDLAFYNLQSASSPLGATIYEDDDLTDAGWTYGYISPANFELRQAIVRDSVLAPSGPGYKALIVLADQNLTLASTAALQGYANAGLPIIFLGGEPGHYPSGDGHDQEAVLSAIARLRVSSGVHSVAARDLVPTLTSLGLVPRIDVQTNGTWWTTWREDVETNIDYAFVFGDTNATNGEIVVQTTKTPYLLDAWTGETKPLLQYAVSGNVTTIPLSLAGNETATIAFTEGSLPGANASAQHVAELSPEILGLAYSHDGGLVAHVQNSVGGRVEVPSGQLVSVDGSSVPPALVVGNWTLTAEHWEAPADLYNAAVVASKYNTTHEVPSLVSWRDIPGLANASGIGYYTTTLTWPPAGTADLGAYISFPPLLHAVTLYINGERTLPLNYLKPVLDVSSYLREGENEVLAIVPTTMRNYLLSIQPELENAGSNVTGLAGTVDNGLIGEVRVLPFKRVRLDG